MKKIRYGLLALCLSLGVVDTASARVDVSFNLSLFPDLVPLPGYPVYYAPAVEANFFFYDGMYWLYENDTWYASSWYNGPWDYVDPAAVPLFVLRIPVRYYRRPPPYFRDWRADAPPRWGYYWGPQWEQRRIGWDHWDRRNVPRAAPLPIYQRPYSGDRYPRRDEQPQIRDRDYHYQPHDKPHAYEPGNRDRNPPQPAPRGPEQRDFQQERQREQQHGQPPVSRHDDSERSHPQQQRDYQPAQRPQNSRPDAAADNRDAQSQRRGPANREPQQRPPETQNRGGERDNRAQGPQPDKNQGRDRNGREDRNGQ